MVMNAIRETKCLTITFMIMWSQIVFADTVHEFDVHEVNNQNIITSPKFITTPFHQLVVQQFDNKQEKLAKIKALLDQGADVNAQNEDLRTPLWLMTFHGGDLDVIKLLIQYKADITIPDVFNETPLHNLVTRNNTQA